MNTSQRTKAARQFTGPVIADLAESTTPGIAQLDARWAALVLAGQALDYAITPTAHEALSDVLEMLGLTPSPLTFGRRA